MSQDMMQALSGSSLLSLSIGTLPAGKPGMNLDANPFASQLALMTGTDGAVSGMIAPVAVATGLGEGGFAAALADLADPAPMDFSTSDPVAPAQPEVARRVVVPGTPIVAALPDGANTAQVIEAALNGAAVIAKAPQMPEAPGTVATLPVAHGESDAEASEAPLAAQSAAQPSLTVQPLPHDSRVPHLRNLIRTDAPVPIPTQAEPEPEPVMADAPGNSAPALDMPVARADDAPVREALPEPALPVAMTPAVVQTAALRPEAPVTDLNTTDIAAEAAPEAPRRSAETRSAITSPERPAPRPSVATRATNASQPVAATSVQPAIAPMAEDAADMVSQPVSAALARMQPVAIASEPVSDLVRPMVVVQPGAQDQAAVVSPALAETEIASEAPHTRKARVLRDPVAAIQSSAPEAPSAQSVIAPVPAAVPSSTSVMSDATAPIATTPAPKRMVVVPQQPAVPRSAPHMTTDQQIATGPIAAQPEAPVDARLTAVPVAPAPAQPAAASARAEPANVQLMAGSGQAASVSLASSDAASVVPIQPLPVSNADPAQTGAASVEPRQQAPLQQAAAPQVIAPPVPAPAVAASDAVRIAQAAPVSMAASVQTPTPRAQVSPAARRAIDAALQPHRTADPRTELVDRGELSVQPGTTGMAIEPVAISSIEAVPPAWAAALNAVTPQVPQTAAMAAPQGAAQAQVPIHNLAFDAGFVAGIESQIAKLADGGQIVKIQVMPEHLGRIDIEMLGGPDRDQVRIITENDAVRDTLVSSQHRLEQDLRNQGQRNTEVTVELRQQSPGTQNGSAQQQQQRGQSGAESASARDAAQRASSADQQTETKPAPRRPRGNVRYA